MRPEQRSPEAQAYRWMYKRKLWLDRRAAQLAAYPLCQRCYAQGRIVAANTANHVIPHKGDWTLFITGKLESLCAPCHSGDVQSEERTGHSNAIGADGMPTDKRHPFYAK